MLGGNNNEKFRSFKSKENIHKKEVGPYHGFGYLSLISDPINLAKGARGRYCEFASFNNKPINPLGVDGQALTCMSSGS